MQTSFLKAAKEIAGTFIIMFLVIGFFRWGHWSFNPRPSDEHCKQWLSGQKVFVQKGLLFDDYWIIRSEEFSSFKFTKITRRGNKFHALVQFELHSGQKGLWVEAIIAYELDPKQKQITFESFTPDTVSKRGKW